MDKKVTLTIDPKRLTVDDLIVLGEWQSRADENGKVKLELHDIKSLRDLVSSFVVDGDGQYLERDESLKYIGKMSVEELYKIVIALSAEFKRLQEKAVPPTNASN